jgi:Methyltransferase domain
MPHIAKDLEHYLSSRNSPDNRTVAEVYGTENFCHMLHSLIRMERPTVVVELGCGGAATALMVAKALNANGHGHLWTIDNGSDWKDDFVRETCLGAAGLMDQDLSYAEFIGLLCEKFGLSERFSLIELDLNGTEFFDPGHKIDMLFADATPSHAEGCLAILKYYLPRMSSYSSIFIDRAGTINHAWMVLRYVVDCFRFGKLPRSLTEGSDEAEIRAMERLVSSCEIQLINLTETKHNKPTRMQNSRAWIKIQPLDYKPHNDVLTFSSITSPWASD